MRPGLSRCNRLCSAANQCYGRFWSQYSMCQQCLDAVCDGTLAARYEMKDDEASFKRFIRLINAAHSIGFTGLRSGYNFDNFFKPFNAQCVVSQLACPPVEFARNFSTTLSGTKCLPPKTLTRF